MHQRLFLSAVVATLLLTTLLPGMPALTAHAGGVSLASGVASADDIYLAPTAAPPAPDGSCHGSGHCGD